MFRILFFLILAFAFRVEANLPSWDCKIAGTLAGDAHFTWSTGRDAWQGPGTIKCIRGNEFSQVATILRYESFTPGFGAGPSSQFNIESDSIFSQTPYDLTLGMIVDLNQPRESLYQNQLGYFWNNGNSEPALLFKLKGDLRASQYLSLTSGSLEIFLPMFFTGQ